MSQTCCRPAAVIGATRVTAGTGAYDMTSNERPSRPLYEHPWAVRLSHWSTAVAITILTMSGLRILSAFPSFGPKIPERDLIDAIPKAVTLGGWLGGALRWHFTFMWIFAAGG